MIRLLLMTGVAGLAVAASAVAGEPDGARRLTVNPTEDFHPTLSPDGRWLAFDSTRDGRHQVYVAAADGGDPRRLTDLGSANDHPRWLADGRIVFESERHGPTDLFMLDPATGATERLTVAQRGMNGNGIPSPSGDRIAFLSTRDGDFDIFVMAADGSGQRRLTDNPGHDFSMAWSPDGTRLAFMVQQDGKWAIRVVDMDGRQTSLTDGSDNSTDPVWSPDGRSLAFSSDRDGAADLYLMAADGSGVRRIGGTEQADGEHSWSPDGRRLVFVSGQEAGAELYLIDADGSNIRRLTTNTARETVPAWSPDGRRIVFVSDRDGNLEIYGMDVAP